MSVWQPSDQSFVFLNFEGGHSFARTRSTLAKMPKFNVRSLWAYITRYVSRNNPSINTLSDVSTFSQAISKTRFEV